MHSIRQVVIPPASRLFSSQALPSSWIALGNLKKENNPNIVKISRGEVVDIYKKTPSGEILKSVEHRFASVPEHAINIEKASPQALKKLGVNPQ